MSVIADNVSPSGAVLAGRNSEWLLSGSDQDLVMVRVIGSRGQRPACDSFTDNDNELDGEAPMR